METDVQSQIAALEEKIQQLRGSQLSELQQQLKEARANVANLEAQIQSLTGKAPAGEIRRKRTSSEDVRGRILKALSQSPQGLSQKEISDLTGLNYNTVVLFLKKNPKDFKTTGTLRSKRYFLK
ncbi:MAG: hypothetical protein WCP06_02440 [Verrucomicrobiota bacterium]